MLVSLAFISSVIINNYCFRGRRSSQFPSYMSGYKKLSFLLYHKRCLVFAKIRQHLDIRYSWKMVLVSSTATLSACWLDWLSIFTKQLVSVNPPFRSLLVVWILYLFQFIEHFSQDKVPLSFSIPQTYHYNNCLIK